MNGDRAERLGMLHGVKRLCPLALAVLTTVPTNAVTLGTGASVTQPRRDDGRVLIPLPTNRFLLPAPPDSSPPETAQPTPIQSRAPSAYQDLILGTSGLVAYFRIGATVGSASIEDLVSGTVGDVSATGVTLGVSGAIANDIDRAASFDAARHGQIQVPYTTAWDFGTGDFSLEFWLKVPSWPRTSEFILGHDGDASPGAWEAFVSNKTNRLVSRIGGATVNSGPAVKNDGGWHHIVLAASRSGNAQWYCDGRPDGATSISNESAKSLDMVGQVLWIGRRQTYGFFDGSLDEIAIYKAALSSATVAEHYDLGHGSVQPDQSTWSQPPAPTTAHGWLDRGV
jgi:hypothetical protein